MKERVKTELSAICKRNERNRKRERERERKGEREGGSTRARGCQAYITEKGKGPLGEEVGGGRKGDSRQEDVGRERETSKRDGGTRQERKEKRRRYKEKGAGRL